MEALTVKQAAPFYLPGVSKELQRMVQEYPGDWEQIQQIKRLYDAYIEIKFALLEEADKCVLKDPDLSVALREQVADITVKLRHLDGKRNKLLRNE